MINARPTPAIETRLRVLSWNLWWQFGPWQERAAAITKTLKKLDADVIGLQEIWGKDGRNSAALQAKELGYHYHYAPGAKINGVRMGNAILSRWPILKTKTLPLGSDGVNEEMRIAIFAQIDGPRGKIPVFCTHLNWQMAHSHIRQQQVRELVAFVKANKGWKFPPVICGDFNADPQSEEIRMMTGQTTAAVPNLVFHDAWAFVHGTKTGDTWDNINPFVAKEYEPNRRIDYIFTGWPRPDGAGHITDCKIVANAPIDGIWPSDHFALLAELRY